jgi:hypothetical protein
VPQQGRLTDPRLAGGEHHPSATVRGHLSHATMQHTQLVDTLEQPAIHVIMMAPEGPDFNLHAGRR